MPLGSTHDRITLWTCPGITLTAGWLTNSSTVALAVGSAYLFSGLMFSGDLDIRSRQYQRWLGLRWIWLPYRKMLRHRSFWSHGPVVGTILRLIYLAFWILPIVALVAGLGSWRNLWPWQPQIWGSWLWQWIWLHLELLLWISLGLELGAMNHSLADWIISAWKRHRRLVQQRKLKSQIKPQMQSRLKIR